MERIGRKRAIQIGLGALVASAFGVKKTVDSNAQPPGGGGTTCNWVCQSGLIGGNARKRCCYQGICWWAETGYVSWCPGAR